MADDFSKNFLSPVGFDFSLLRIPQTTFHVQSVILPGIVSTPYEVPNPLNRMPVHGDHPIFDELSVTFKINEDMGNYIEIFDWIRGQTTPDNYGEYEGHKNLYSDATLSILTSQFNPAIRIELTDCFHISLTPIEVNVTDTAIEYIDATAGFRFQDYSIKVLS